MRGDRLRLGKTKACAIDGHRWLGYLEARNILPCSDYKLEHSSWLGILKRVSATKGKYYRNYGARGITVCDRWRSFKNFVEDMGRRPGPEYSIDRYPNQDGNYEPGNCRWATTGEQTTNRCDNIFVDYNGERVLLVELTRRLGVSRGIVYGRLKLGWGLNEALHTPVQPRKKQATAGLGGSRSGV